MAILSGCASAPRKVYNLENATQTTFEALMRAWDRYVEKNHPPIETEQKVKVAADKYLRAMELAIDISHDFAALQNGLQTADGKTTAAILQRAVANAAAALAELKTLIESIITQPAAAPLQDNPKSEIQNPQSQRWSEYNRQSAETTANVWHELNSVYGAEQSALRNPHSKIAP